MTGLNFVNFPLPNTLYTTPINIQWGMMAFISLKSSGLKASKGRREIKDTNPFSLFQSPSFCLTDSHLKGGEGEKISDQ